MTDLTEEPFKTLAGNDSWVLVQPHPPTRGEGTAHRLYMTWIAEQEIGPELLASCKALNNQSPDIPGTSLRFQTEPTPGFVLEFKPGWLPKTSGQLAGLMSKVFWEIERIHGRPL